MAVESPFICGPGVGLPVLGGLVIACVRRGLLQILGPVHVVKCPQRSALCSKQVCRMAFRCSCNAAAICELNQ